jgi:serine/threonine protein kinase
VGFEVRFQFTYTLLEFAEVGDLTTFINKFEFSENDLKSVIFDIISAVKQIHSLQILHLDLKPDNLLMKGDGHVVLADFGVSEEIFPEKKLNWCTGTPGVSFCY